MRAASASFIKKHAFPLIATAVIVSLVGLSSGTQALLAMVTLTALEITFSLDNAVVNAQVLQRMSPFWQRMFMTIGIIIAVFGMRLLLPLVVVAITANIDLVHVANLAWNHPQEYAAELNAAHAATASFGGMFLLMIFLEFILGETSIAKRLLRKWAVWLQILVALIVLAIVAMTVPDQDKYVVLVAGAIGLATNVFVSALAGWFTARPAGAKAAGGLATFWYLETLDASFSFDGVIGAFAVTTNVVLITAGLGVGAVWVRSITIDLVKNGALKHYPYLDLGAHIAIGALAALLLVGIAYDLPDLLTGGVGLVIILTSFLASVVHNRRVARTGALAHKV